MSPEQLAAFLDDLTRMVNRSDIKLADQLFVPRFIAHVPITPVLNRAGFKSFLQGFFAAFPDLRLEVQDTVLADNRLILRLMFHGTHKGDFMGIGATGDVVVIPAISIFRIEDGGIIECWMEMDLLGVIHQLSRATVFRLEPHPQNLN